MAGHPSPPVAARIPVVRSHHGHDFVDDYEWLRDKDSPAAIAYLEAENAYTEARTAHLAPLRASIFEEIRGRIKETDMSVPVRSRGWWYYVRTLEGKSYPLHCRVRVEGTGPDSWTPPRIDGAAPPAGEDVLVDGNALAEGHAFFDLGALSVTRDGRLLAYSVDTTGDERYDLRVKDLHTGTVLPDVITGIAPGATWSPCGEYLFYTRVDEAWRPHEVWRHRVGDDVTADVRVFHEPDERYWVGVGRSASDRYVEIAVGSKITTESHLLDADDPTGEFRLVRAREEGVEYYLDHAAATARDAAPGVFAPAAAFTVVHNASGPDFALAVVAPDGPDATMPGFPGAIGAADSLADLPQLLPHLPGRRLEDVAAHAKHLVVSYREGGLPRLGLIPRLPAAAEPAEPAGLRAGFGELTPVAVDEELYSIGASGTGEYDAPLLRVGYTSFVTPTVVADLVLATGALIERKRQPVLGGYDPSDYEALRLWATAVDGERIPISLVRRRGTGIGASGARTPAPTVLYGYGSYETSIDPSFSVARLSLLDRGMAFAIAHVRGGGEMGRHWYERGRRLEKVTTFTDFVACADALLGEGWAERSSLIALGGSAGGLLMGAVANLAPDRFAGIQAAVPFVDPLTSILMPELPLTVIEWDEWGDPLHDAAVYEYMRGYSPYENVAPRDYPAILALTSLHDTRVLYVEPAKWVARLRAVATSANDERRPILLKTEMEAGHGGVSGRYEKWRETAFEYAWILDIAGRADTAPAGAGVGRDAEPSAVGVPVTTDSGDA